MVRKQIWKVKIETLTILTNQKNVPLVSFVYIPGIACDEVLKNLVKRFKNADVKVRTLTSKAMPACRVTKCGISTRNRLVKYLEKGKTEPFGLVSHNLAEQSALVFERYKYMLKD
ncbi:hypothetical protein [Paenibacillus qinlingensis]|uniref:hypothetical protein n=1 Tax=Paenibacillus qinlingensis TaxID=1837343 RepID=UPI00156624E6|nr:hypothetical protein [Paenibacillus qinlingensis]NQX62195.1 hypothetical protein [Paenibacillus qinlingensis]